MKKPQLLNVLLGAAILLSATQIVRAAPQKSAPFAWGITGHPGVQEGYPRETLGAQLDLVKQSGARWYRCDWPQSIFDQTPQFYDEQLREAKKRGLKILPILFPTVALDGSVPNAEIRARGGLCARRSQQISRSRDALGAA